MAATLIALFGATGLAQTDQGKISGVVRDQSDAFVAGAKVTVKNALQVKKLYGPVE